VTLECFCGWPSRTLVDCMRGNPDVRSTTGSGARRRSGKSRRHPRQKCPFPWGSGPHLIHSSLGPTTPHLSISSAVFARLTAVTDRQTDRPRYSVCSNRPHRSTGVPFAAMDARCDVTYFSLFVSIEFPVPKWPVRPRVRAFSF